jgi:hypothetical protein
VDKLLVDIARELVSEYGGKKALEKLPIIQKAIQDLEREIEPSVYFGPNPLLLKLLVLEVSNKGSLDLESAWKKVNTELGVKDADRSYTKSHLEWNPSLFEEKTSDSAKKEWRLTSPGKALAQDLSSENRLTSVDKAVLGRAYLADPIAKTIYSIYAGKNRTRQEGIKELASMAEQLQITPGQAEWFVNEKTSALAALGLLSRSKKGKETVYS